MAWMLGPGSIIFGILLGLVIMWFKKKPKKDKVVEPSGQEQRSSWTDENGKYHIRSWPDYVTCSNVKCNAMVAAFKGDLCPNCNLPL